MEVSKPIILLVDKDELYCRPVEKVFAAQGYMVQTTSTFEDAYAIIHEKEDRRFVVFVDTNVGSYNALLFCLQSSVPDRVVAFVWTTQNLPSVRPAVFRGGGYEVFHKATLSVEELVEYAKRAEKHLDVISSSDKDFLTKLDNYRAYLYKATAELKAARDRGHPHTLYLLLIDVDGLHSLNEIHGYLVADECLKRIGKTIQIHVRSLDYPFRKSGDEFLVLLVDGDMKAAVSVGEKLQREVSLIAVEGKDGSLVSPTISFGVGEIANHEIDDLHRALELLFNRADTGPTGLKAKRALVRR